MYINLAHFLIPKICAGISFIINPLMIYTVWNDQKLQLGNYRYLLFFFGIFNFSASVMDCLVPWVVHNYRNAFCLFLAGGIFQQYSDWNQLFFGFRCSFVSGTYAVLHSHFLYRFLVLFNNSILTEYFVPYGIILMFFYLAFHQGFWVVVCYKYIRADFSRRLYVRDSLMNDTGLDAFNVTLIVAQYREGPYESVRDSWIGIGGLSILSFISLIILCCLGWKIVKKLKSQTLSMSEKTKRLQTQLMKALVVQAAIPTIVSFSPCLCVWYEPLFMLNFGSWIKHAAGITVATFPVIDPLALLIFVPAFRGQFMNIFHFRKDTNVSATGPTNSRSQSRVNPS